jgi:hypothetical protein
VTNTDIADRINKYTDLDTRVSVKQTERIVQAMASDRVLGAAILVLLKAELPAEVPSTVGQTFYPKEEVDQAFRPVKKPSDLSPPGQPAVVPASITPVVVPPEKAPKPGGVK